MDLWTVLSNSSTITSLAQVMIDLYTREEKLQQLHAVRIDNIIDYQSIAADLHTSFENLDKYLSSYHERYLTGKVLLQEERELFICAFFQKYPLRLFPLTYIIFQLLNLSFWYSLCILFISGTRWFSIML